MDTLPKKITDVQDNSIADITINAMPSVFDQSEEQPWNLPDILKEISTSETLANMVSQVRKASTEKVRKARKKAIPLFWPCI